MRIENHLGLSVEFLENGSVKSIAADPVRISLKAASPSSRPGANLYLRKKSGHLEYTALMGPESQSRFNVSKDAFVARGSWSGLEYECSLQLSPNSFSWQWLVDVKNNSGEAVELDLIWLQDIGLKPLNAGLINEYYVSQYLERRILQDENCGVVICCRQNMRESTGHPWLMMVCKNGAIAGCTDGMQFFGKTFRETGMPEGLQADRLGGEYAGESSVVALQEKPFILAEGESHQSIFMGIYQPDHPLATSEGDLKLIGMTPPNQMTYRNEMTSPNEMTSRNLFNTYPFLPVEDLDDNDLNNFFGPERRHEEYENSRLISFFSHRNNHVVLREKEVLADRPHAHIMQAKSGLIPDESIVSTTAFMFGVFNSHLTQGNTNFNVLLSICTSQFNQATDSGQRLILTIDNRQFLLGVPSAFETGLNHCRYIYKHGDRCYQVRTWTSRKAPQVNLDFKVLSGGPVGLQVTHDFDRLNGWRISPRKEICESVATPDADSMIASKFPGAQFRMKVHGKQQVEFGQEMGFFTIRTSETNEFCMSFLGEVTAPSEFIEIYNADEQFLADCTDAREGWKELSLNLSLDGSHPDILAIREILPWYGMNALTHYLTPYGLEQFGGAAWGTRDVSQGPVDLLLALEKYDEARQVLLTIFSNQNPDGGWPQWWMFDSYFSIRAHESHGDIFYWCIIALSHYIRVTGDLGILEEVLPYYHEKGPASAEKTQLGEHVDRLIKMITDSFIPGTFLVPYGGGDWNDSLQPVSQVLASRMISSWTVEMNYEAFSRYAGVFEASGQHEKSTMLTDICRRIRDDFNEYLVKEGIVAGYGLVEDDRSISVMLHPSDSTTGIRYSLLPMERGILSGIFTPEQAAFHQELIEKHLKGPDGARLMDMPLKYRGGMQKIFQRAESSTFFGREIGLMYVHEHIRYAESLARTGKAEAFVKALRQAIPVGYRDIVPCGDIRQANCYYSSSDVHFRNRYEADERYDEVLAGKFTLRGGWRVYSSGPGIYLGLIIKSLLGIRIESDRIVIDPVMPGSFDGLSASMDMLGLPVTFRYHVKTEHFGPKSISINGKSIAFPTEDNPYRKGGAVLVKKDFLAVLDRDANRVEILL